MAAGTNMDCPSMYLHLQKYLCQLERKSICDWVPWDTESAGQKTLSSDI